MSTGIGASLNGFVPFPADNLWNKNIASATVDPNSDAIINFIGATTPLHPDFGSGLYGGQSIGIPYIVVSGQPLVEDQLHGLWRRERSRTNADSRECSHRGISQAGQR